MTMVEILLAMAIMAIIFAVLVPQFRLIQNSWDTKIGASETLQNGRVLIDHINRNLSKASRITAVSDWSETNGYIEFLDNDANNVRYDVNGISDYVEFGLVGNLSDLAGPVSQLQFTCYDASDLSTPITDVNAIRSVKVETTLTNPARLGQDMTFTTQVYIRTNTLPSTPEISKLSEPWLDFDPAKAIEPALCQIDQTHYLCAYEGPSTPAGAGWAVVLTVNPVDWTTAKETAFQFASIGMSPALAQIDQNHYLCAYEGDRSDGYAVVLTVDTGNWTISNGTSFEFDTKNTLDPALAKIDNTHYLCVYEGFQEKATAVILNVDPVTWEITMGTPYEFDATGEMPSLCEIDATHYLCVYQGQGFHGTAIVLAVDTVAGTVSPGSNFTFDPSGASSSAICQIDSVNYLCVYPDQAPIGISIILRVDPLTWNVSEYGTEFVFDLAYCQTPALAKMEGNNYLCAYSGGGNVGFAVSLTVDTGNWDISKGTPFEFDIIQGIAPALCQVDGTHYLCAYQANIDAGLAGILRSDQPVLP